MKARVRPEPRRATETFEIVYRGQVYRVTLGHVADSSAPIEVFVSAQKTASDSEALARDAAIVISFALQFGAPAEALRGAVSRGEREEPASLIGAVLDAMGDAR